MYSTFQILNKSLSIQKHRTCVSGIVWVELLDDDDEEQWSLSIPKTLASALLCISYNFMEQFYSTKQRVKQKQFSIMIRAQRCGMLSAERDQKNIIHGVAQRLSRAPMMYRAPFFM